MNWEMIDHSIKVIKNRTTQFDSYLICSKLFDLQLMYQLQESQLLIFKMKEDYLPCIPVQNSIKQQQMDVDLNKSSSRWPSSNRRIFIEGNMSQNQHLNSNNMSQTQHLNSNNRNNIINDSSKYFSSSNRHSIFQSRSVQQNKVLPLINNNNNEKMQIIALMKEQIEISCKVYTEKMKSIIKQQAKSIQALSQIIYENQLNLQSKEKVIEEFQKELKEINVNKKLNRKSINISYTQQTSKDISKDVQSHMSQISRDLSQIQNQSNNSVKLTQHHEIHNKIQGLGLEVQRIKVKEAEIKQQLIVLSNKCLYLQKDRRGYSNSMLTQLTNKLNQLMEDYSLKIQKIQKILELQYNDCKKMKVTLEKNQQNKRINDRMKECWMQMRAMREQLQQESQKVYQYDHFKVRKIEEILNDVKDKFSTLQINKTLVKNNTIDSGNALEENNIFRSNGNGFSVEARPIKEKLTKSKELAESEHISIQINYPKNITNQMNSTNIMKSTRITRNQSIEKLTKSHSNGSEYNSHGYGNEYNSHGYGYNRSEYNSNNGNNNEYPKHDYSRMKRKEDEMQQNGLKYLNWNKDNDNQQQQIQAEDRQDSELELYSDTDEYQQSGDVTLRSNNNDNLGRFLQIVTSMDIRIPLQVEIDQTGYLKSVDTGMYMVDQNGDGFQLDSQEIDQFLQEGLIAFV